MPPDDTNEWDDADLPGLDDSPPSEPAAPTDAETSAPEESSFKWTTDQLDEWFESEFGGHEALMTFYPSDDLDYIEVKPAGDPDLHFGLKAYKELAFDEDPVAQVSRPWSVLSHEARERFRRGWQYRYGNRSPAEVLAAQEERKLRRVLERSGLGKRWIFVAGGFGVIGLVLVFGFFFFGESTSSDTEADPRSNRETAVQDAEETAPAGAVAESVPRVTVADEPVARAEETFETTIGASRFVVTVPQQAPSGGRLPFTVCSYDAADNPRVGDTGFFSIGRDPAGPQASHAGGTLGSDGCFSGEVEVKESPGMTNVLTSDGSESAVAGEITIVSEEGG